MSNLARLVLSSVFFLGCVGSCTGFAYTLEGHSRRESDFRNGLGSKPEVPYFAAGAWYCGMAVSSLTLIGAISYNPREESNSR